MSSRGSSSAGAAARGSKPSVRRSLALDESEQESSKSAAEERSKWYAVNLVMRLQENALAARFLQPPPSAEDRGPLPRDLAFGQERCVFGAADRVADAEGEPECVGKFGETKAQG